MRNFTPEDFSGCGQYLLRMSPEEIVANEKGEPFRGYANTGYLTTILYKVGYVINNLKIGNGEQLIALIAMSDGNITMHHYPNSKKATEYQRQGKEFDFDRWEKVIWQHDGPDVRNGKQIFCDHLNTDHQEMRFATQEEVVRAVLYQKSRWR